MEKNILNISEIETYLNNILDGVVSNNTFFTTIPDKATVDASNWKDMVLVTMPEGISDFEAYGQGHVFIILYARPLESGKKNVAVMSVLEQRLNDVISNTRDKHYAIVRSDILADYDDDINWHCNVVELILTIL